MENKQVPFYNDFGFWFGICFGFLFLGSFYGLFVKPILDDKSQVVHKCVLYQDLEKRVFYGRAWHIIKQKQCIKWK